MPLIKFNPDYYPNPDGGRPIGTGKMYIGEPGTDPTLPENQKQVLALETNGEVGSIPEYLPIAQPIRTNAGGVPISVSNRPVILYVSGDYSMALRSSTDVQIYYIPTNLSGESSTEILSEYNCDFQTAVSLIGSIEKTHLIVDCFPAKLKEDLTITENITVEWRKGFILSSDELGPYTVTVEGEILAGFYQLFDNSIESKVNLSFVGNPNFIKASWADDFENGDVGVIIQKIISAGALSIELPSGNFTSSSQITPSVNSWIKGQGKYSTNINIDQGISAFRIYYNNVKLSDFSINRDYSSPMQYGIRLEFGAERITLSDILVESASTHNIWDKAKFTHYHNIHFKNSSNTNLYLDSLASHAKFTGFNILEGGRFNLNILSKYNEGGHIYCTGVYDRGVWIAKSYNKLTFTLINNGGRNLEFTSAGDYNDITIIRYEGGTNDLVNNGQYNKINIISYDRKGDESYNIPNDYILIFGHAMAKDTNGGSGGITTLGSHEIIRPITFVDPLNNNMPGSDVNLVDDPTDPNTFFLPKGLYKIDMTQVISNFRSALVWIETVETTPVVVVNSLSHYASDIDTSLDENRNIDIRDFYLETDGTKRYTIKIGVNITNLAYVEYDAILGKARVSTNVPSIAEFYMVTVIKKIK